MRLEVIEQTIAQGMSDADAALYGGIGGGIAGGILAIIGVIAGALLERYLQRRGKVRCEIVGWRLYSRNAYGEISEISPHDVGSSFQGILTYDFNVKFFNEKGADTGLRDMQVVFFWKGEAQKPTVPLKVGPGLQLDSLLTLNLPSRRWVSLNLQGAIQNQEAERMLEAERVELRAYFPSGRLLRQTIPQEVIKA